MRGWFRRGELRKDAGRSDAERRQRSGDTGPHLGSSQVDVTSHGEIRCICSFRLQKFTQDIPSLDESLLFRCERFLRNGPAWLDKARAATQKRPTVVSELRR